MRKQLLPIVLLCLMAHSYGQISPVDSLQQALAKTSIASERLPILLGLLSDITPASPINEKAKDYFEEAYQIANSLNDKDAIGKLAQKQGSWLLRIQRNPEKAIRIYDSITPIIASKVSAKTKADLYYYRSEVEFSRGNFTRVIDDSQIAASYYENEADSLAYGDAQLLIGRSYANLSQLAEAVRALEKGLRYVEGKSSRQEMVLRFEIATLYSRNGLYEKAEKEQAKLVQIFKDQGNLLSVAGLFYNQSNDLGQQKDFDRMKVALDSAAYFLNQVKIRDSRHEESKAGLELLVDNVYASYYIDTDQMDKATEYLAKAESKKGSTLFELYKNALLLTKGKYYEKKNEVDKALGYIQDFIAQIPEENEDAGTIDAYQKLHQLYSRKGDYKEAYEALTNVQRLEEKLKSSKKNNAFLYYQTLYETERKEAEIYKQQTNIKLLENDNDKKRKLLLFGGLGLAAVFGFVLLARNRMHLKKSKILQEQFTQDLLNSQESERERISKDLHDGLGQSLLLIKNKVVLSKDENTQQFVDNAIEEVRSISRALHPFQLRELGLTRAIQNTVDQIDESHELFINSNIENIDGLLEPDNEVHLYRIIQESFNNILKHAEAQAAKITISKNPSSIVLSLEDNGKGFDFSERYNDFKSLGLKTLKERTKLLKGQMEVDSEKGKGTSFSFKIPFA